MEGETMSEKKEKSMLVKTAMREEYGDNIARNESDKNSRMSIYVVITMVALLILAIILVRHGIYSDKDSAIKNESKEKTVEQLEEEYKSKLESARRETLDQHLQLAMIDEDALAVDLVYIDSRRNKHYVEYLLGDNSWVETMKRDDSPSIPFYKDSYDFDSDYTVEQFDELVRVFKHDENAKMLAVSIVEEYYDDSDNDLMIPNRRMRQSIKNGLKTDENNGKSDTYESHSSIDRPKYYKD